MAPRNWVATEFETEALVPLDRHDIEAAVRDRLGQDLRLVKFERHYWEESYTIEIDLPKRAKLIFDVHADNQTGLLLVAAASGRSRLGNRVGYNKFFAVAKYSKQVQQRDFSQPLVDVNPADPAVLLNYIRKSQTSDLSQWYAIEAIVKLLNGGSARTVTQLQIRGAGNEFVPDSFLVPAAHKHSKRPKTSLNLVDASELYDAASSIYVSTARKGKAVIAPAEVFETLLAKSTSSHNVAGSSWARIELNPLRQPKFQTIHGEDMSPQELDDLVSQFKLDIPPAPGPQASFSLAGSIHIQSVNPGQPNSPLTLR